MPLLQELELVLMLHPERGHRCVYCLELRLCVLLLLLLLLVALPHCSSLQQFHVPCCLVCEVVVVMMVVVEQWLTGGKWSAIH